MIKCNSCRQWKDTSQYWVKRTSSKTGYQGNCKGCCLAAGRRSYRLRHRKPVLGVATMTQDEFWGQVDSTTVERRSAQR